MIYSKIMRSKKFVPTSKSPSFMTMLSTYFSLVHSYNLNLIIGVTGILTMYIVSTCFDCQTCNFDAYEYSNFNKAVRSNEVEKSGIALLVSSCPLLLDLFMDMFSGSKLDYDSEKSKQRFIYRTSIGLVTLMFGVHVVSQGSYFNVIKNNYAASFFFRNVCFAFNHQYLHNVIFARY